MREDGQIDYVEFPGQDMGALKAFYSQAFGWTFTDYGPDYAAFDQGLEGGLCDRCDGDPGKASGGALCP